MTGEPKMNVVGSQWYMTYSDIVLPVRRSRNGLMVSSDRGITWTDLGPYTFSFGNTDSACGVSGQFLDPNDGNWYQVLGLANNGISDQGGVFGPGTAGIVKSTTGIQGPYTQINTVNGVSGSWAESIGPSTIYWDGTNYNYWISGAPNASVSSSVSVLGNFQATTLTGTFTPPTPSTPTYDGPVNGPNLTAVSQDGVEGVDISYNSVLGLYILLGASTIAGSQDYSTVMQTSANLTFPTSGWKHVQWVDADFHLVISDGAIAKSGENQQAMTGPNGEMVILNSDQRPNWTDVAGSFPHYTGLVAHFAVLEPAAAVIRYTGSADETLRGLSRAISHTDVTIEAAAELTGVNGGGGLLSFAYRSDGSGNNEYRAVLTANGHWSLGKVSGGTPTTLAAGSGSQAWGNFGAALGVLHRLKVQVIGNVHSAWLDGEQQYTFTDSSSPLTSGTTLTAYGEGANFDVINLSCRTSDTITVTGMQPDTSCWLRAACGIPIAPIVANGSGVGTLSYGHFPLFSLDIAGTDYTVGTDSRIWGGDTLQFSGLPSSPPAIPNIHYFS